MNYWSNLNVRFASVLALISSWNYDFFCTKNMHAYKSQFGTDVLRG